MISFDFCQTSDSGSDRDPVENLGQVVFGERLRASPYEVCMIHCNSELFKLFSLQITYLENVTDKVLCKKEYDRVDDSKLKFLRDRIHEAYMYQW